MNPRRRRLVLPGLLAALVLVVVVASLVREAQAADTPVRVTTFGDARISESSGLVLSVRHDDLVYTVNDSGHAAEIFAVRLSDGATVGVTTVRAEWRDVEALALAPDGTLWVADTGDNLAKRNDAALFALPEPGPGNHTVTPQRYPIEYEGGPFDVETLLLDPTSGDKFLVSKRVDGGRVFRLPELHGDSTAVAEPLDVTVAPWATDGAITPDGRTAIVRDASTAYYYDLDGWAGRGSSPLPSQPQGETLAVEASGTSFLVGSEGVHSALYRVTVQLAPVPTPARVAPIDDGLPSMWWYVGIGVLVLVGGIAVIRFSR